MSKGKWVDAEKERAVACETSFQNGGPRVYVYESGSDHWKQRPSSMSAAASIRLAYADETIYARRKHGQRYVWRKWVKA